MLRQLALTAAFVAFSFGPSVAQSPRMAPQPQQAAPQQQQQAQPPALAHPNQGQPPQLNMDEVKAFGGGKVDPNGPDQTVEPANGQPQQQTPGQNMQPQQVPGQNMIPGGLR